MGIDLRRRYVHVSEQILLCTDIRSRLRKTPRDTRDYSLMRTWFVIELCRLGSHLSQYYCWLAIYASLDEITASKGRESLRLRLHAARLRSREIIETAGCEDPRFPDTFPQGKV